VRALLDTCVLSELRSPRPHPGVSLTIEAFSSDDLYVSGTIGAAAAGLRRFREILGRHELSVATDDRRLMEAYLRPDPRVRLGLLVARNRAASACMDLSDGLADAVHQIAEASGVGITIDAAALPIDPAARAFFESRGGDAVIEALTGGDDYELLFAARPRMRRRLAAAAAHGNVPLTRIGRCHDGGAVTLQRAAGGAALEMQPMPGGYSHFARQRGSRRDA